MNEKSKKMFTCVSDGSEVHRKRRNSLSAVVARLFVAL